MADKRAALLVFLNDFHVGHPFAVCPAKWTLHSGQPFVPNSLQRHIRKHLLECLLRVRVIRNVKSANLTRLVVAYVGDIIEGLHHDSTEIITARLDIQKAMAVGVIMEALEGMAFDASAGDTIEFITGTDAHDGPGAASLNDVARQVLGVKDDKRVIRERWLLNLNGVRFDIAHHPEAGIGTREHTKGNVWAAWLKSYYTRQRDLGDPWPRYVIRAHRHEYLERAAYDTLSREVMRGWILPPWKATDEFVVKHNPSAVTSIGMLAFEVDACGNVQPYDWRIKVEHKRDKYEVL